MVGGAYTHLDNMLASQCQPIDWTQHTTCRRSISWGNLLAPGTMHEKTSHETSLYLDSCFDHNLGLIMRKWTRCITYLVMLKRFNNGNKKTQETWRLIEKRIQKWQRNSPWIFLKLFYYAKDSNWNTFFRNIIATCSWLMSLKGQIYFCEA